MYLHAASRSVFEPRNTRMTHLAPAGPRGPLVHVLTVRGGTEIGPHFGIHHREALMYTLGKAAALEHVLTLQYLFAACSLTQSTRDGMSAERLAAAARR